jgi:hypothetical protein
MRSKYIINPLVRTAVIASLLLTLVSGVTYAALQSQSKLTGSSIQTATANLLVGKDTTTLSNTSSGYAFNNLIPGGTLTPSGGHPVYLKNAGGTPLSLKFAVSSLPTNLNGVDLTKVMIHLNSTASGQSQSFPLQTLVDGYAAGGSTITLVPVLFSDQTHPFTMQVSMAKDAFDGQTASIGAIDFVITGTATS